MYCPKCGSQNADDATYCAKCGNLLRTTSAAAPASAPSYPPPPPPAGIQNPVQGKDPFLAAILNFFFGLGYIYLGKNKVLGVPTIVFVVLALVVYFLMGILTFGVVTFILAILLAVDGYEKGRGQKGFISAE